LLRAKRCDYILGLSRNKTLDALAEPWREQCRWRWKPGLKVRRFHQFQYAAESWTREEKVIARVEATELGTDARFIVTNLTGSRGPQEVAPARRHLRDHPQRLREDRGARRGAEALDQACVPAPSAARRCAGARRRPPHRARPMTGAADAARAPSHQPPTRAKASRRRPAVNPADVARLPKSASR
jgi:hypothetical protein